MSRRRRTIHQAAGDDSFLDIVANIVGILIILIVVAGVRAGRAPVDLPHPVDDAVIEPVVDAVIEPVVDDLVLEPPPGETVEPEPWPQVLATAPEVVDRTDEVTDLAEQLAVLEKQLGTNLELLTSDRANLATKQVEIGRLRKQGGVRKSDVDAIGTEVDTVLESIAALERNDREARRSLEALGETPTPAIVEVRHRWTPVGTVVRGVEQHFHVRKGRVASIPLEPLKQRVRDQMSRYGRAMSRYPRHEGQVGPVDGFVMEYTVERRPVALVDELRHGRGMVRIAVTRWTIRPEPELESESIDRALSSGSRFRTVLRASDPKTALTFWVYPDSFSGLRRLQTAAHKAGFRVASRPLPTGITISGSPDGTRSQSQ